MGPRETVSAVGAAVPHPSGGFAFLPGGGFASAGVIAVPGQTIERASYLRPLPWRSALDQVYRHLDRLGRSMATLCALELRLPATMSITDFRAFNERYLNDLNHHGLLLAACSPLARVNVVPVENPPAEPVLAAFSYTAPTVTRPPAALVITGVAEMPDRASFPDGVIRHGEFDHTALTEKAMYVAAELRARILALGSTWHDTDRVRVYSARRPVRSVCLQVLDGMGIRPTSDLVWHRTAPPVLGLELEMDVRRLGRELVLED
jgi:hypothetical protein